MKKIILLLSFAAAFQFVNAQTPQWLWAAYSSNSGGCCAYTSGIAADSADNIFIGGRLTGTTTFGGVSVTAGGADNPFVGMFDSSSAFNSTWMGEYTYSSGFDYSASFCIDRKDNVYLGGWTNSGYNNPMFLEKYNRAGVLQWELTPPNSAGGGFMGVAVDNSGYIYVAGNFENGYGSLVLGSYTLSYTGSGHAVFIAKLDSNGNVLWATDAYGTGANDGWDVGRGITVDNMGHIFVAGSYTSTPTFYSATTSTTVSPPACTGYGNLFVAEYDTAGNPLNVYTATNAGVDNGDWGSLVHIVADSCSNVYVTGYYEGTAQFGSISLNNSGGHDAFVAKLSNLGVWEWANGISGTSDENGSGIVLDKNSDVYAVGSYSSSTVSFSGTTTTLSADNCYVAKYTNSSGALLWAQGANVSGGGFNAVAVDHQKYVYVTGSISGSSTFGSVSVSPGSGNNFVAKLDTLPVNTILPVVSKTYCPGATVTLPYTVSGTFNSGNSFTAQLSDSTGSFVNAQNIGDTTATGNGTITITIPANTTPGSTYLIRVISSNPTTSSWVNGCGAYFVNNVYTNDFYVTIGNSLNVAVSPIDTNICAGAYVTLNASGGGSYTWSNSDTGSSILVTPVNDTTVYTVQVKNGGCAGSDSVTVIVSPAGAVGLLATSSTICEGQSLLLMANGYTSYTWSPDSSLSATTGDSILASPLTSVTYTVTGTNASGCTGTSYDTVSVVPVPNVPSISQHGDTLKSSAATNDQWYENGKQISGATSQDLVIGSSTDTFTVVVVNPADGCSSSSAPLITSGINQLSIINSQLSIYPNPTNGNLYLTISSSVSNVSDWNLRLTDVLGQTIYTRNSLNYSNVIDLSDLAGGVYFITVTNKTGEGVFKIIKQ